LLDISIHEVAIVHGKRTS